MQNGSRDFSSILVTGGAGFIGSNFIRYLYYTYPHARIVNLDLLTYAGNRENLRDIDIIETPLAPEQRRSHFIQGDICNETTLEEVLSQQQFDAIFHFAAESHVDRSFFNKTQFSRTNIDGTRLLADAALKHNVSRFIHISTDEVYGSIETGSTNEEYPFKPSNPYSTSKAGADLLVQGYMRTRNLPAVIVRGSNNYGPYQYPEKLIPLSITSMLQDRQVPVHGSGEHVRSWLHVHDFCRAIDTVARTAADYSIYNVSGEEKTNMEILTALATYLKKDINTVKKHVSDRPGPDMRYSPDSTRLTQELGWRRLLSFNETLGEVVHWYQTNEQWWRDIQRKPWFIEQFERQSSGRWV